MIFLVQLNYADLPALDGFPRAGLLRVFVADDDLSGCDFPSRDQTGFRTLFAPDPAGAVRRSPPAFHEGCTPLGTTLAARGAPLTGRLATCPLQPQDWRMAAPMADWPDGGEDEGGASYAAQDAFYDALGQARPGGLYFGGNPGFTQSDFRSNREGAELTEVLLQMGFIDDVPRGWGMMWGDVGEACFLISPDDLAAGRFDRAAYNWDCC